MAAALCSRALSYIIYTLKAFYVQSYWCILFYRRSLSLFLLCKHIEHIVFNTILVVATMLYHSIFKYYLLLFFVVFKNYSIHLPLSPSENLAAFNCWVLPWSLPTKINRINGLHHSIRLIFFIFIELYWYGYLWAFDRWFIFFWHMHTTMHSVHCTPLT